MKVNFLRLVSCGALAWVFGAGGCSCEGRTSDTRTGITFEFPLEGATLSALDDSSPGSPGVQVNVRLVTNNVPNDTTVVLTNSVDVDGTGAATPTSAKVQNDSVTFPAYTLPTGTFTLRAALSGARGSDACDGSKCATIQVTAVDNVCRFNSPRDGDVLATDQYPDETNVLDPFEIDVVLDCFGIAEGGFVALSVMNQLTQVAPVDATGRVTFARIALGEGQNQLSALADTDAAGDNAVGGAVTANITVDSGRCEVALTKAGANPSDRKLLALDDLDLDGTNGMQAGFSVSTTCAPDATPELYLRRVGEPAYVQISSLTASPANPGPGFLLSEVAVPESVSPYDIELVARVVEPSGTSFGLSLPRHFWVDSARPQLLGYSPATDACFAANADSNSALAGLQVVAFGSALGAENGSEVWVSASAAGQAPTSCTSDVDCTQPALCRANACRAVGQVTAGGFSVADVTLPEGDVELGYTVNDLAGNTSSTTVALRTFADAPTVAITAPATGARLGAAADTNLSLAGLQTVVSLALVNVPPGSAGRLVISGQAPVSFVPPSGTNTFDVPVDLQDGTRVLTASVKDGCGTDIASQTVTLSVASKAPDILVTAYRNFAARQAVLDGATVAANQVDIDIVVGEAPQDRTLTITHGNSVTFDPSRACGGTINAVDERTVLAANNGAMLTGIALGEGTNCFTITSDDGINAVSTALLVYRRTDVALPTIILPAAGAVTDADADDTNGVNTDISIILSNGQGTAGGTDVSGHLALRLVSDASANMAEFDVVADASDITLPGVGLPAGSYDLFAVFTDVYGNSASSQPVALTVGAGGTPEFFVSSPKAQTHFGVGNLDVSVTRFAAAGVDWTCDLLVDGNSELSGHSFASGESTTTLTLDPTGLAEGSHVFLVRCSDGAETGYSQSVDYVYDVTAPDAPSLANEAPDAPGRLLFDVSTAYVNSKTPDTSSVVGLQHGIAVVVPTGSANPIGWSVRVSVTAPGAAPVVYERIIAADGGNPTLVLFDGLDFGSIDGDIVFSAQVLDLAGNTANTTPPALTIDRTLPTVTQQSPDSTKSLFTRAEDVNIDPLYIDLAFRYGVTDAGAIPAVGTVTLHMQPVPAGMSATDFPLSVAPVAGVADFSTMAFADSTYLALATGIDRAGNEGVFQFNFEARKNTPQLTFSLPNVVDPAVAIKLNRTSDQNAALPLIQAQFALAAAGMQPGSPVTLCSTVAPPGPTPTACRWGSAGDLGGNEAGFVVAQGTLLGATSASSVFWSGVTLADGLQTVHAEAREQDGQPDIFSSFIHLDVDVTPPVVSALTLSSNNPANDGTAIRLNASEGTVSGVSLRTPVSITTTGALAASSVRVYSTLPVANTLVGSGTLDGAGAATFNVNLREGAQTLRAEVRDAHNNLNDPTPLVAVDVDFTNGTVLLSSPLANPYTSAHGTPLNAGDLGSRADDVLPVSITVEVSDNRTLAGATVRLTRTSPAGEEATVNLSEGQTTAQFDDFALRAGVNSLTATFTDAAGNAVTSAAQTFRADFYGPVVALKVVDKDGVDLGCTTALPCEGDIATPTAGRAAFDVSGADAHTTAGGSDNGTDVLYTLTECANSEASIENCTTNPAVVRLESRLPSGVFAPVFSGIGDANADVATFASYYTERPSWLLDPGSVRELRLVAVDKNGNTSVSNTVAVKIDLDGVVIEVVRLKDGATTGRNLADFDTYGIADNDADAAPGTFKTGFQVLLTAFGANTPTTLELTTGTFGPQSLVVASGGATFLDVPLAASTGPVSSNPNSIEVTAMCGASACGQRDYLDVIADIEGPRFQFDRCSLCALKVPLVNDAVCGACVTANDGETDANIVDPGTSVAEWNALGGGNRIADGSAVIAGWNIAPGRTLEVLLENVEAGQSVRLDSPVGSLSGNVASASNCSGGNCRAIFNALTLSSSDGTAPHELTVSFTDAAGNAAQPDVVRGEEILYARVDVQPPSNVSEVVCIGESTTPEGVDPASDARTYERPECEQACTDTGTCSRRKGETTVMWTAPDAAQRVASYEIAVAALGIPYPDSTGVTASSCANIDPTRVEQTVLHTPSVQPGDTEQASVTGLYPHRSYCFRVMAVDELGNKQTVYSAGEERVVPLLSYPTVAAFTPHTGYDAAPYYESAASDVGVAVTNVGDLDGDGSSDFVAAEQYPSDTVLVFQSKTADVPVIISAPTLSTSGFTNFGGRVAGGDFDGDGYSDLAVCAQQVNTGGTGNGGALYLYYGSTNGISTEVNVTDPLLPSRKPDVALLGPEGARFCYNLAIGHVAGSSAVDLVVANRSPIGPQNKRAIHVFVGGSRSRFPAKKIQLDLLSAASPGFSNRPEFAITTSSSVQFAVALATADVDGNGYGDIVFSDPGANAPGCSGCGVAYVFSGGPSVTGDIGIASALHTLYLPASNFFGLSLVGIQAPHAPEDTADWLAAGVRLSDGGLRRKVVVFRGETGTGLDLSNYQTLDDKLWDGTQPPVNDHAGVITTLKIFDGHGGIDLVVGANNAFATSGYIFFYSLQDDDFQKRAILYGPPGLGLGLALTQRPTEPDSLPAIVSGGLGSFYLYR